MFCHAWATIVLSAVLCSGHRVALDADEHQVHLTSHPQALLDLHATRTASADVKANSDHAEKSQAAARACHDDKKELPVQGRKGVIITFALVFGLLVTIVILARCTDRDADKSKAVASGKKKAHAKGSSSHNAMPSGEASRQPLPQQQVATQGQHDDQMAVGSHPQHNQQLSQQQAVTQNQPDNQHVGSVSFQNQQPHHPSETMLPAESPIPVSPHQVAAQAEFQQTTGSTAPAFGQGGQAQAPPATTAWAPHQPGNQSTTRNPPSTSSQPPREEVPQWAPPVQPMREPPMVAPASNRVVLDLSAEAPASNRVVPDVSAEAPASNRVVLDLSAEAGGPPPPDLLGLASGAMLYPPLDPRSIECFEHDWQFVSQSGIAALHSRSDVAEMVCQSYTWIVAVYRRLSSKMSEKDASTSRYREGSSVLGINQRNAIGFLESEAQDGINVLDNGALTKAKAEQLFKEARAVAPGEKEKLAVQSDRNLVRYQFTNWLIRLAISKCPEQDVGVAVSQLFPIFAKLGQKYCTDGFAFYEAVTKEAVAAAFAQNGAKLQTLFNVTIEASRGFMTVKDWAHLLNQMDVYTWYSGFSKDTCVYAYRLGLETYSDEQSSMRFQQMSIFEFQRAIGAVLFLSEFRPTGECTSQTLARLIEQFCGKQLLDYIRKVENDKE